jgi:hypothetical protein
MDSLKKLRLSTGIKFYYSPSSGRHNQQDFTIAV